jgi:hypothetical protein
MANFITEGFKRFWLEKALSLLVSVKMIIMGGSAALLCFGFLSGDNFVAIIVAVTSAYGINKAVQSFRKLPKILEEK